MSLYTRGEPASTEQFRTNTAKLGVMVGVMKTPNRCRCIQCDKLRTEATGQHKKAGFVCHGCGVKR